LPGDVSFATDAAKEIPVTRLWFVLTIAAVLARAAPAAAQQQPAPAPPDQGNGNWDPPPITKPTTQRWRPAKLMAHQRPGARSQGRGTLRKGKGCRLNQSPVAALPSFSVWRLAVTPLNQLRLRLPNHDFDRLMQAAKPVAEPDRDALLKDIAAELGQHEVVGPGLLHRIISEVQRRYDVADRRRSTGAV
jgi:hypothetical protein